MKKLFSITLITLLTLSALKTQARVFGADELKANISKQVIETYKQYTDAELSANVIALPFKSLQLPDGKVTFEVNSTTKKFLARDLKKIVVKVDNKYFKTFNAPVEVKAYKEVLVASRNIDRESTVSKECVVCKKVEISDKIEYTLTSEMLNREIISKKTFTEGEVIDKRFVKLRPDVQRNADVRAFFSDKNLMISIEAKALSDGMIGDYIEVKNQNYKRTYTGKIIGENKVLIGI